MPVPFAITLGNSQTSSSASRHATNRIDAKHTTTTRVTIAKPDVLEFSHSVDTASSIC